MNEKKHGIGHNIRQAVLVTVVLLVLCGLVFPVLLSGLSAVIFPCLLYTSDAADE